MVPRNQIVLRREIYRHDVEQMATWMQDEGVTEFLNEDQNIDRKLHHLLRNTTIPLFSPQFNRDGRFFMISLAGGDPIGFMRLISRRDTAEIVVVIGDREQWGKGYGYEAVRKGLEYVFAEWGKDWVVAKIHKDNERSRHVFRKAGMTKDEDLEVEEKLSMHASELGDPPDNSL